MEGFSYQPYKLKYAKCSGDMAIQHYAEKAERAIHQVDRGPHYSGLSGLDSLHSYEEYDRLEPREYDKDWYNPWESTEDYAVVGSSDYELF